MVWSILVEQGREGVAARVRSDNDLARQLTDLAVDHPRLEALTDPQLSIACVRYVRDDIEDLDGFNSDLLRRVLRESPFLPSCTVVNGRFVIRPCFMNVRTTPAHVAALAAKLVELGDEMG